ncbi:MAG: hypothetical protein H6738_03530 [Alphaproteobacteria bacterium]|nr:hypothetical protein [Alphaproteobacteria bacterium]MCB9695839.1 hypothetical protein [Alphaproteobacteria bacterium]
MLAILTASAAWAHHPHDPIERVDLSSGPGPAGVILASRLPNQNWRPYDVMRSEDGGVSWAPSFTGLDNASDMSDLDVSPEFDADGVAMVTTLEEGAWVSVDFGRSWEHVLDDVPLGSGAVVHDGLGPVLLAAQIGGALLRSEDLGATWDTVTAPALVGSLSGSGARAAYSVGSVYYWSDDAGTTWDSADVGVDIAAVDIAPGARAAATVQGVYLAEGSGSFSLTAIRGPMTTVAVSPAWAQGDRVVIATGNAVGAFVSEDGGATMDVGLIRIPPSEQATIHYYTLRMSRGFGTDRTVLASRFEGLFRSGDAGHTWMEFDTRPPALLTAIALSPRYADDHTLLVGSYDSGVWSSTDGGDTFEVKNTTLPRASAYDIQFTASSDGTLVSSMALRDKVIGGTAPFDEWSQLGNNTIGYPTRLRVSPNWADDGVALLGMRTPGIFRTSDFGATWVSVTPQLPPISDIAFDEDARVVLTGHVSGRLGRSTDGGQTFASVPPFAPTPVEPVLIDRCPGTFLIGTGLGVYTSSDGVTFVQETDPRLSGVVHEVACGPDGTRFVAMRAGGLFRLEPSGPGWVEVGAGMVEDGPPAEIVVSPTFDRDHTVFAAVDQWLYRSTDGGDRYRRVGIAPIRYEEDAQAVDSTSSTLTFDSGESVGAALSLEAGDTVEILVRGIGLDWLGATGGGTAQVELDGSVVDTVDTSGPVAYQQVLWSVRGLPDEAHRLVITCLSGTITFDAFDVWPYLPPPPPDDTGTETGGPPETGTPPTDTGSTTTDTDPTTTDDGNPPPPPESDGGCHCASATRGSAGVARVPLALLFWRRRRRSG